MKFTTLGALSLIIFSSLSLVAQDQDSLVTMIKVEGRAFDETGLYKSDLLVINERTYTGFFGNTDGTFSFEIEKTDTVVLGSIGYSSVKVCYADSAYKPIYKLEIQLHPITLRIGAAVIVAPRDLDEIQNDIRSLGFEEKDYRVSGIDVLSSPITFLYEMFSKREQSKRLAYELENEDRRRDLLKELFVKYVDYEIIDLSTEEFDDFIDFIGVDDTFLKSTSQYDFIIFVKNRFEMYKVFKKARPMDEEDFYYHED
ncbi:MAG: hypothetical protein ACI84C_000833 [Flavobacteriales bacterium]|jgi:hypothetical protein